MMRKLFALLIGLGWVSAAGAVTLHGTPVEGYDTDGNTTISVSMTIGAGSRLGMYVGFGYFSFGGSGSHTGCTFNGDAMTQVTTPVGTPGGAGLLALYALANPDVATGNVVCTATEAMQEAFLCAAAFTDVNQATPTTSSDTETSTATSVTLTPTVAGSNVGVDFVAFFGGSAVTQSDTLIHELDATGSSTGYSCQRGDGTLITSFDSSQFSAAATAIVHDGGAGGTVCNPISGICGTVAPPIAQ